MQLSISPRLVGSAVILAVLVALHPLPLAAQEPQERPTFSSGVSLVPITAVVRDSKSRIVRGLSREDFQVLENSQPRAIREFTSTANGPVSLGVLFDTSGSMRGPNLDQGRAVVDRLMSLILPASDEVALFTFDRALRQETDFTADPNRVRTALARSDAWGTTSIYDAIADAARRVSARGPARRALVVITDGLDTSSTLAPMDVAGLASATDVPVYVLPVVAPQRETIAEARGDLADLAYWTGGDLLPATTADETGRAVAALIAELRQQYFLAIEASATTGWYRLDVTTKRRNLTVRTRSGYFAGAADSPQVP